MPAENENAKPNLLALDVCSLYMIGNGSSKTAKMVRALVKPDEKYIALELKHLPSMSGFQKYAMGRHWSTITRKIVVVQAAVQKPRPNIDHRIQPIHLWGNSRT